MCRVTVAAAVLAMVTTAAPDPAALTFDRHWVWQVGESVFLSGDGGQTWREAREGLPVGFASGRIVALSGVEPRAVMVTADGLFRYEDDRWLRSEAPFEAADVTDLLRIRETLPRAAPDGLSYRGAVRAIYAKTDEHLWRSGDGGRTWATRARPPLEHYRLSGGCDGAREVLYAAFGRTVYVSADVGGAWARRDENLPDDSPAEAMVTPVVDNPVHARCFLGERVYTTHSGGVSWTLSASDEQLRGWSISPLMTIGPLPSVTWLIMDPMSPRADALLGLSRGGEAPIARGKAPATVDLCPFHLEAFFYARRDWTVVEPTAPGLRLFRRDAAGEGDPVKMGALPMADGEISVACRFPGTE